MLDSKEYQEINDKIDLQTHKLNRNEKMQSEYMATHGCEDHDLLARHDTLCNEMDTLLQKRHEIAHREDNK